MAKIVIKNGQQKGTAFELKDQDLSIGRNATNDIFLSDRRVSRNHAKISRKNSSFEIEDLESVNGTTVNNEEIKSRSLQAGDQIQVGDTGNRCRFRFILAIIVYPRFPLVFGRIRAPRVWIEVPRRLRLLRFVGLH